VRVWKINDDKCVHALAGHELDVTTVSYDGNAIVSGSIDNTVRVWRAPFETSNHQCMVLKGHTTMLKRVWLCAPPNQNIVVSVDVRDIHVHDIRTGKPLCKPIKCYVDHPRKLPSQFTRRTTLQPSRLSAIGL
jgi:WD40 repeat protein